MRSNKCPPGIGIACSIMVFVVPSVGTATAKGCDDSGVLGKRAGLRLAANPSAKPSAEAALIATAVSLVDCIASGKYAQASANFDTTMKAALPAQKLELTWKAIIMQAGKFSGRQTPRVERMGPHTIVLVPGRFARANLDFKIVFSGGSKISGFFMVPASREYKEESYVVPRSFKEQFVTVGSGEWKLDGILSIPAGEGPFPALVLVHGSGPEDKDETIGPNKPFRDIAKGLASKGIAVLRYNKRTMQHQSAMAAVKNLTVIEESVSDAVEAVKLLQATPKIDCNRLFVLGHSLGGMLIPRIAAADPHIRGFISLAGSNEPLEEAMARQAEYLASLGGENGEAARKGLDIIKQGVEQVKGLTNDTDKPVLGVPASYWLDLRKHNPLEEIKSVEKPILFMQGGRDYQVTPEGDFQRWKDAVRPVSGSSKLFTFKLYPACNHLFIAGSGQCTPAEYLQRAGNVDPVVITDIAEWVNAIK